MMESLDWHSGFWFLRWMPGFSELIILLVHLLWFILWAMCLNICYISSHWSRFWWPHTLWPLCFLRLWSTHWLFELIHTIVTIVNYSQDVVCHIPRTYHMEFCTFVSSSSNSPSPLTTWGPKIWSFLSPYEFGVKWAHTVFFWKPLILTCSLSQHFSLFPIHWAGRGKL